MALNGQTEARKLRSRLSHPVVDADGHWLEYLPVMREQFKKIAGDAAVEELAFAATQLGFKVIMVGGLMRRPVPAVAEEQPEAAKFAEWFDVIGIDSDYDYDPVWQKCRELKLAPSFHNGARSILLRNSP